MPPFQGRSVTPESRDLAVIFATSGTTGLPKAVPLTHSNLIDNCLRTREAVAELVPGDVLLNVLPNFHSFGYTVSTVLPLTMNARMAIVPAFLPPQTAMKAILEAPVTVLFAVPANLIHEAPRWCPSLPVLGSAGDFSHRGVLHIYPWQNMF